jgi:hypothetical protein
MKGQGLNDLPRCELERRSSHHKGIFFEVPIDLGVEHLAGLVAQPPEWGNQEALKTGATSLRKL